MVSTHVTVFKDNLDCTSREIHAAWLNTVGNDMECTDRYTLVPYDHNFLNDKIIKIV